MVILGFIWAIVLLIIGLLMIDSVVTSGMMSRERPPSWTRRTGDEESTSCITSRRGTSRSFNSQARQATPKKEAILKPAATGNSKVTSSTGRLSLL
jgi:hypothetical protein